jgi:hypothetical protein
MAQSGTKKQTNDSGWRLGKLGTALGLNAGFFNGQHLIAQER